MGPDLPGRGIWAAEESASAGATPRKAAAPSDEKARDLPRTLEAWGKLGAEKDGLRAFTWYRKGDKGRVTQEKLQLSLPEGCSILVDRASKIEDLQAEEDVQILGKTVVRDVPSKGGTMGRGNPNGGKDRQFPGARAIFGGKALEVSASYQDPADSAVRWRSAKVSNSKSGLWVKYENEEYRVTLERQAPVLRRVEGDAKLLQSGAYVLVKARPAKKPIVAVEKEGASTTKSKEATAAKKSAAKSPAKTPDPKASTGRGVEGKAPTSGKAVPSSKKIEEDPVVYEVEKIVVLDPRCLKTVYPAVLP
jgi:hypothetical protein